MFYYEKDLNITTTGMGQTPNSKNSNDIKKNKGQGTKKELTPPFSCFCETVTSCLSPKHLNSYNTTEISFFMVSQICSEQINAAKHLRGTMAL